MRKKTVYLWIMAVFLGLSLGGIKIFLVAFRERGLTGVNYGCFLPVLIALWFFFKWRKAE